MKVLVIGSGGREHAIALAVKESPKCSELIMAPGNPGMASLGRIENLSVEDIDGIVAFSQKENVELVIVGPEVPLCMGLVDALQKVDIPAFGPSAAAARLEGSKAFSKDIMAKYNVPTATYKNFTDLKEAQDYLRAQGAPIVIKASGLAAGKGAIVCMDMQTAEDALEDMLGEKAVFGESGKEVVIEEFMEGEEVSLFAVCDGKDYVLLSSAQDHKRIGEGDTGLNTGGMGAYAPAPVATPELIERAKKEVIEPTLAGMQAEGCPYAGVLYVGLMVKDGVPKVVEYNVRFGDPECQIILPLYKGDVLELLEKASTASLGDIEVSANEGAAVIVVLASQGYPASYPKGEEISIGELPANTSVVHAGTKTTEDGKLVSNGGRVLGVVGHGDDLKEALDVTYKAVENVNFKSKYFRKDIGAKGLTH